MNAARLMSSKTGKEISAIFFKKFFFIVRNFRSENLQIATMAIRGTRQNYINSLILSFDISAVEVFLTRHEMIISGSNPQ
jgi:hypothetical protein